MARVVKKPDIRREEIILAARKLFNAKDYAKATMQDLMQELNIAKGTIYHYFSSKEDLLEAVVANLIEEEVAKKKKILAECRNNNHDALHILKLFSTTDTMAEDNESILEMLHQPGNIIMHTRQLGRYLTRLAPIYASVIEEGCKQELFQTEHPLECAEFLLAGIQFLTDTGFHPWTREEIDRRMSAFPSLLEDLLNAPVGSFSFLGE
ncbi:MAG: TetR/AcrR family transcriptional regulator [Desulfopila sp.]|jgi:AcrR family transcriptional regulator|nr:TetR/AcrR family transcriptional regulator [Desulfopila sp.]